MESRYGGGVSLLEFVGQVGVIWLDGDIDFLWRLWD